MSVPTIHPYAFDPTAGMTLDALWRVAPPEAPDDFAAFWRDRHRRARAVDPRPMLATSTSQSADWHVLDIVYASTGGFAIGGWLLLPRRGPVRRGLVVGHGYGGREGPDFDLPVDETAILFPCFRGLSRSARPAISQDPAWHVLHDIQSRDDYIIGGCVDDVWVGVSALVALYPWLSGRIGYAGISFGGGLGALAIPFDDRIDRGHLSLPTFGHQPLRLQLPSVGSASAVQDYQRAHGTALETLRYFDAASAAALIGVPMLVAAALFDPAVAPPCQFAIFNAMPDRQEIFILDAGHFDYAEKEAQEARLRQALGRFFGVP